MECKFLKLLFNEMGIAFTSCNRRYLAKRTRQLLKSFILNFCKTENY